MTIETIHRIGRPFAEGFIEVYGEPDMGWYEWRIVSRGEVLHDTRAAGYGSASLALRDALNHDTSEDAQEGTYRVYVRGVVVSTHRDRESAEQAFWVAEAAFVEALVGAGWNRTAAEDEAEIVMSIGIGNPSAP